MVPSIVYIIIIFCLILGGFSGVTLIPKFVFGGILASEGFMVRMFFRSVDYLNP